MVDHAKSLTVIHPVVGFICWVAGGDGGWIHHIQGNFVQFAHLLIQHVIGRTFVAGIAETYYFRAHCIVHDTERVVWCDTTISVIGLQRPARSWI